MTTVKQLCTHFAGPLAIRTDITHQDWIAAQGLVGPDEEHVYQSSGSMLLCLLMQVFVPKFAEDGRCFKWAMRQFPDDRVMRCAKQWLSHLEEEDAAVSLATLATCLSDPKHGIAMTNYLIADGLGASGQTKAMEISIN